jgi:predicted Zn-dependent peptidase
MFELPGEAPDYYETLVSRAQTVTTADVQRVAQGYLQPHAITILQLGP